MGCSNSNILNRLNPFTSFKSQTNTNILEQTFEARQKKFLETKKVKDLILSETLVELTDKLIYSKEDFIKSNIDRIYEKNIQKLDENSISKFLFENGFYSLLADSLIKKEYTTNIKNLVSYLKSFITKKNIVNDNELDILMKSLADSSLGLTGLDTVLQIDLCLGDKETPKVYDMKIIQTAISKLKYDDSIYPTAIFLNLNFEVLNSKYLTDFCEALVYNNKLTFIAILLNPLTVNKSTYKKYLYNMNPLMYSNLFKIFEATKNNKNIRHLIFTSLIDNKIVLAPEISNIILQIITEDNLFGFYLGKISLTENFLEETFSIFANLQKLKYFCFDIGGLNTSLYKHLRYCLSKNRVLELIGFLGFVFDQDELISLKENLKRNFYLKMILNKQTNDFY